MISWYVTMFLNIYIYIYIQYSKLKKKKKNVSHVPQWQPSLPTSTELGKSTEISPFKTSFTSPTCRAKSKFNRPLLVDTLNKKNLVAKERSCIIMILPYTYHICFFTKNHTLNSKLDISDISCRYFGARISKGSYTHSWGHYKLGWLTYSIFEAEKKLTASDSLAEKGRILASCFFFENGMSSFLIFISVQTIPCSPPMILIYARVCFRIDELGISTRKAYS